MTTLPTREDGGIDCAVLSTVLPMELSTPAVILLAQKFAAHERERCAKWHDKKEAFYLSIQSVYQARMHRESAAGLRKQEP